MAGTGYAVEMSFLTKYEQLGRRYLDTDEFWHKYHISARQAKYDRTWVYAALQYTQRDIGDNKALIRNKPSQDGFGALLSLINDFDKGGSLEQRQTDLEQQIYATYNSSQGTLVSFLDDWIAYMEELASMDDVDFTNKSKLRLLYRALRDTPSIQWIIDACKQEDLSYKAACKRLRNQANTYDRHRERKQGRGAYNCTKEDVVRLIHKVAQQDGTTPGQAYQFLSQSRTYRQSLRIPDAIWERISTECQDELKRARSQVKTESRTSSPSTRDTTPVTSQKPPLPRQYSNPNDTNAAHLTISDDNTPSVSDTSDDDAHDPTRTLDVKQQLTAFLTQLSQDDGYEDDDSILPNPTISLTMCTRTVYAHTEYYSSFLTRTDGPSYNIMDDGADTSVIGSSWNIDSYTGRSANLVGFDSHAARKSNLAIVSGHCYVHLTPTVTLRLIAHEAIYNPTSPITLLSEYQLREYGAIVDSTATHHRANTHTGYGLQQYVPDPLEHPDLIIPLHLHHCLMKFPHHSYPQADTEIIDITITQDKPWNPITHSSDQPDPDSHRAIIQAVHQEMIPEIETQMAQNLGSTISDDINTFVNQLDYHELVGNSNSRASPSIWEQDNHAHNPSSFDSLAFATITWNMSKRRNADPHSIQPLLAWRPIPVIQHTLRATTQLAKAIYRGNLRRHVKRRFPHLAHRLSESVSTDTIFSNCKSAFHGHTCAQVYYGIRSHCINIYGMKTKGEMHHTLDDFIREHGAPSCLRRDNAKEEQNSDVQRILRNRVVKDEFTEPHHPQQNPVERHAIRWLKMSVPALLDRVNAPDTLWFMASQYLSQVHNICADESLNWQVPIAVRTGITPDISAFLQFRFWEPILYLDPEAAWPSSKEKPGRFLCPADNYGDALTYWIYDEASRYILCRSVVRPRSRNLRVKWDPALCHVPKHTASIGGDIHKLDPKSKPSVFATRPDHVMDKYDIQEPEPTMTTQSNKDYDTATTTKNRELKLSPEQLQERKEIPTLSRRTKPKQPAQPWRQYTRDPGKPRERPKQGDQHQRDTRSNSRKTRSGHRITNLVNTLLSFSNVFHTSAYLHEPPNLSNAPHLPPQIDFIPTQDVHSSIKQYHTNLNIMNPDKDHIWEPSRIIQHAFRKDQGKVMIKLQYQDGDTQWRDLELLRYECPVLLIKYGIERKLIFKEGWEWVQNYINEDRTLRKMFKTARARKTATYQFGVKVPQSVKQVHEFDAENGNTLWADSLKKELDQLDEYEVFKIIGDGSTVPEGYKVIPYNVVYACKFDLRRKSRLVAGGHKTDPLKEDVYSGVVSMDTVRLGYILAALNGLSVCAADVGNAYLNAKTNEKVVIKAGPEFGDREGKYMIIDRALYGLRGSGARFHEHLSHKLLKLGWKPSLADSDLWMKTVTDEAGTSHYEYLARYVDDVIVFSKDPMKVLNILKEHYTLKGVGVPEYYLGGDVEELKEHWNRQDITTALSAKTYIDNTIKKLAKLVGIDSFRTYDSPMSDQYRPELDDSDLCDEENISKYRSLVGSANWVITLGRFDVAYAVNTLAKYMSAPRTGHFKAMLRVFGYLLKYPKGRIIIDPSDHRTPELTEDITDHGDKWDELYPEAQEELPHNMPIPMGNEIHLTCYVDADHASDQVTRRSTTGIILFANNTPLTWISRRQKTVETSTYGSELVAARVAVEVILEWRYKLRMLGIKTTKTSTMLGDNMSVVINTTLPSSQLKKKHNACAYHRVREAIAAKIITFGHIRSNKNYADIMTKPLGNVAYQRLVQPLIFRVPASKQHELENTLKKMGKKSLTIHPNDSHVHYLRAAVHHLG